MVRTCQQRGAMKNDAVQFQRLSHSSRTVELNSRILVVSCSAVWDRLPDSDCPALTATNLDPNNGAAFEEQFL
jgi:hypothetical protein